MITTKQNRKKYLISTLVYRQNNTKMYLFYTLIKYRFFKSFKNNYQQLLKHFLDDHWIEGCLIRHKFSVNSQIKHTS